MIDRIQKLMDEKKLSAAQFSEEIGIQRSSLSHVLSGRNKPSLDFMLKIKSRYEEVNLDWLLLGNGEMIIKEKTEPVEQKLESPKPEEPELDFTTQKPESTLVEEPVVKNIVETEPTPGYRRSGLRMEKEPEKVILLYNDGTFEVFDQKSKKP